MIRLAASSIRRRAAACVRILRGSIDLRWLAVAVVLFVVFRLFIVEAYRIPSDSMEPLLTRGDFIVVDKLSMKAFTSTHGPLRRVARGDVIVFEQPEQRGTIFIKRVVGTAGDTLSMRRGALYRGASRVLEPYARVGEDTVSDPVDFLWQRPFLAASPSEREDYVATARDWGPLVVPMDNLFVLGDNRGDSFDSRHWGFVPLVNVRGRALYVYFSAVIQANQKGVIPKVRWNRVGNSLMASAVTAGK